MTRSRFVFSILFAFVTGLASVAFAGTTPLLCDLTTSLISPASASSKTSASGLGVYGDQITPSGDPSSSGTYLDGTYKGYVQCYFGVADKNVNLVTYNSSRKLLYQFGTGAQDVLTAAGIIGSVNFSAESDLTLVNNFTHSHTFSQMNPGSTAQLSGGLEFHWFTKGSPTTYELEYPCLTVTRGGSYDGVNSNGYATNQYVITSQAEDKLGNGYAGISCLSTASQVTLGRVRKTGGVTPFGTVTMPFRMVVTK